MTGPGLARVNVAFVDEHDLEPVPLDAQRDPDTGQMHYRPRTTNERTHPVTTTAPTTTTPALAPLPAGHDDQLLNTTAPA